MPVVASNRTGKAPAPTSDMALTFYGSLFIPAQFGNNVEIASRTHHTVLVHEFDLDELRDYRQTWGVYRDRRRAQYGVLDTFDGRLPE